MPTIKKITLKSGVRYRFVVDVGKDPVTGQRKQETHTFDRKKDAEEALDEIRTGVRRGDHVLASKLTVNQLLDRLVPTLCVDVEESTAANYVDAMKPVRRRLGAQMVQSLDEQVMEEFVTWMLTKGRVRCGPTGTGLSARTVGLTLGVLRQVLDEAVRRRLINRNVAARTRIPRAAHREAAERQAGLIPWTTAEVQVFLSGVRYHSLFGIILLSLMGMRPAEVAGLRWRDVDLDLGVLSIEVTRTLVHGKVVQKDAKSRAGKRQLPLPAPAVAALRTLRTKQAAKRLALGSDYIDSGFVLVDDEGAPRKTDWLRRTFGLLMHQTGVREVRLYDTRHACLTYLATSGVPDVIVSAWAGHADLSFTKRTYIHPDPEHLRAASDALARLFGS